MDRVDRRGRGEGVEDICSFRQCGEVNGDHHWRGGQGAQSLVSGPIEEALPVIGVEFERKSAILVQPANRMINSIRCEYGSAMDFCRSMSIDLTALGELTDYCIQPTLRSLSNQTAGNPLAMAAARVQADMYARVWDEIVWHNSITRDRSNKMPAYVDLLYQRSSGNSSVMKNMRTGSTAGMLSNQFLQNASGLSLVKCSS